MTSFYKLFSRTGGQSVIDLLHIKLNRHKEREIFRYTGIRDICRNNSFTYLCTFDFHLLIIRVEQRDSTALI